jgi:prepilin-type N-terminal cleavage/methylation domain-containing protein
MRRQPMHLQSRSPLFVALRFRRGAFTLVEVLIALAIFAMLAGAIFISVSAVTKASGTLAVEQIQTRKLDAFISWCRKGFRNLSASSRVFVRTRDSGAAGRAVELILRNAPGAFSIGELDALGSDLVLSAVPDGKGAAVFSIARVPGGKSFLDFDRELARAEWLPVLDGIKTLRWTFWNPVDQKFVEEWQEGQGLPEMIRLDITLATGESLGATFRLPRLVEIQHATNNDKNPNPDEIARLGPSPRPEPNSSSSGPSPLRVKVPNIQ